jgi:hypothetical protein
MVAAKFVLVREQAVKYRHSLEDDPAFFGNLAGDGIIDRLAALDAATGKEPARGVTMTHQEDTALIVEYGSAYPQGHSAPQSEPGLHHQEKKAAGHIGCP